jgi:hypothetical protein
MDQVVGRDLHCPHCRAEITARELKVLWSQYCNSRRARPKVTAPPAPPQQEALRRDVLLQFIIKWRTGQGVVDPQRSIANRSTAQLERMYRQVLSGETYRVGRRWKAPRTVTGSSAVSGQPLTGS